MGPTKAPIALLGVWLMSFAFLSLVVSLIWSYLMWGYAFRRPPILSEVRRLKSVASVVPCKSASDVNGHLIAIPDLKYDLNEQLEFGRHDSYYCLEQRVLLELDRRGTLPAVVSADLTVFPDLHRRLSESGALAASSGGYDSAKGLRGVIVGDLADGLRVVVIAAQGGEVSNDHYPYYELAFGASHAGDRLAYLNGQRFFYDVAGVEGLEWYAMWLILGPPALLVATIAWLILEAVRRARRTSRPSARSGRTS